MNTKEKILDQALLLFNEKGVREISTRMISEAASISQGNLTYHYSKKEEIIYSLYLALVEEMNAIFGHSSQLKTISVEEIYQGTLTIYETFYKYRFCLIDFVQLMRDIPKINDHYRNLIEVRKKQSIGLFQTCIKNEVMKPEEFEDQYSHLSVQMSVFGDYWLSHAEILFKGKPNDTIHYYAKQALMILFPYFTEKTKKEARQLL